MKNTEWLSDFAFAVDILDRLNELNVKLQGKGVFAHELFAEIKFFQVKLVFFSRQLKELIFKHSRHKWSFCNVPKNTANRFHL